MSDEQGTEQRFSSIEQMLSALQQQNAAILQSLGGLNKSEPPPRREEPLPEINGTEFLEKPVPIIHDVVGRQVNKLKDDLNAQLQPFAEFMLSTQREKVAAAYIERMEGLPAAYPHIGNPLVRRMVKEAIATAPQINDQFVHAVYMTAVGQAFSTGQINTEPPKEKKEDKTVPAHLRPTSPNVSGAAPAILPELDENQKRIARERGWSPARASYMFQLITAEAYKKLEPDGKLIDFGG
jgi:hypothetical protein